MSATLIERRIAALREQMQFQSIAASVWLSADPHLSEYLPERWQLRAWLSGFTGSAGSLIVTLDAAAVWTDSRYWEQAQAQLSGTGIVLMCAGKQGVPEPADWLRRQLPVGGRVALDGRMVAMQAWEQWQEGEPELEWVVDSDLISPIWADRPADPQQAVYEHVAPYACRTRAENLQSLREQMQRHTADWHLVSALDDIAFLLNLRGSDVSYNPVFLSFLLVSQQHAYLFIDLDKVSSQIKARLLADGIELYAYTDLSAFLQALPAGLSMLLDPARTTVHVARQLQHLKLVEQLNPSQLMKACKTPAELQQVRAVMEQDGAALCEFFAWLDNHLGQEEISELTVDEYLTAARARRPGFVSPSFGTIAAYQANGAMPHYQATADAHSRLEGNGLLLIDSGGQYLGGTTDITRMIAVGHLSEQEKRDCTVVLQGMVAMSLATFPSGVSGAHLDVLARQPLWRLGLDYGHGTGHGVGYFMNVHEGPQSLSWRARVTPNTVLRVGMITSNEPGLYRPGKWGIRIENLLACVPGPQTEFGEFLQFETLTLCPIDTRCIDASLLALHEREWLNQYHAQVRQRLQPLLDGKALDWLIERTAPI